MIETTAEREGGVTPLGATDYSTRCLMFNLLTYADSAFLFFFYVYYCVRLPSSLHNTLYVIVKRAVRGHWIIFGLLNVSSSGQAWTSGGPVS